MIDILTSEYTLILILILMTYSHLVWSQEMCWVLA